MAVESMEMYSTLQMAFDHGQDDNGKPIIRRRSLSNVKPDVSDQDLFEAASALTNLQAHTVVQILVIDKTELREGA